MCVPLKGIKEPPRIQDFVKGLTSSMMHSVIFRWKVHSTQQGTVSSCWPVRRSEITPQPSCVRPCRCFSKLFCNSSTLFARNTKESSIASLYCLAFTSAKKPVVVSLQWSNLRLPLCGARTFICESDSEPDYSVSVTEDDTIEKRDAETRRSVPVLFLGH